MTTRSLLASTHPGIAAEWHPTKNGDLDVATIATFSNQKVWWLHADARGDLHQWQQIVRNRTYTGTGCPACRERTTSPGSFHVPAPGDSLADILPDIAEWWHPTRNGDLTPHDVKAYSGRRVWWQCPAGHEFTAPVDTRSTIYARCPGCRPKKVLGPKNGVTLAMGRPDLSAEWHPTKNGDLTPETIALVSNRAVWWKGRCRHVWRAYVHLRVAGSGCPTCAQRAWSGKPTRKGTAGTLAQRYPAIAAQWHPTKNGSLSPAEVSGGSGLPYWWLCPAGHEWEQSPSHRGRRGDHPACWACDRPIRLTDADRPTRQAGSLAEKHPDIAAWWHPSRNGHVGPADVRASAAVRVWWRCPEGHQWQAAPASRSTGQGGCRRCSNREERNARADVRTKAATA